jgi:hypothetical protein
MKHFFNVIMSEYYFATISRMPFDVALEKAVNSAISGNMLKAAAILVIAADCKSLTQVNLKRHFITVDAFLGLSEKKGFCIVEKKAAVRLVWADALSVLTGLNPAKNFKFILEDGRTFEFELSKDT